MTDRETLYEDRFKGGRFEVWHNAGDEQWHGTWRPDIGPNDDYKGKTFTPGQDPDVALANDPDALREWGRETFGP